MSDRTVSITLPLPSHAGLRWLAIGLATGLLAAVVASPLLSAPRLLAANPAPTADEHTISVTGTGKVTLSPDTADLRLGVLVTAASVKDARNQAADAMSRVIAALKGLGISDADIKTSWVSLQPTYDYQSGANPPHITGYQFSNSVAVTLHDLAKVGDAIDAALAAGATSLDGVSFRVADEAGAEAQAREAAMTEARAKAQTLASAAGVSISGVASISETMAPVPYPIAYGGAAAPADGKSVPTPVQPGTTDVSVTIAVVYLIG
ncbi:MAG TPA: SIMPL domain-containing protein [Candidatus Limnocylindrales bacterium]|jgi:hypothetical protein